MEDLRQPAPVAGRAGDVALLVCGWLILPGGAVYWTVAVLLLLLLPTLVQGAFGAMRALLKGSVVAAQETVATLGSSLGFVLIFVLFLPHQVLLSVDAIVRSAVRQLLSGKNLLEWETAAQAESGRRRNSLDLYLYVSPLIAAFLAATLYLRHRGDLVHTLVPAAPVLVLWAVAPLLVLWLDASPRRREDPLTKEDAAFLREQARRIWRFFDEFGGARNHWLVPDNVEEQGLHEVRTLSPTNLGMLLNARQAAYAFGFVTLPEFAEATLGTLATYARLEKVRGHIYNWIDIETLTPIQPFTISTVDSGNLAASLYTLHAGALELLRQPILTAASFAGLDEMTGKDAARDPSLRERVRHLFAQTGDGGEDAREGSEEARRRAALQSFIRECLPWLQPEFAETARNDVPVLMEAAAYARSLADALGGAASADLCGRVREAEVALARLCADVEAIAEQAYRFADAMDFAFLFVPSRQLLSIGYDAPTDEVLASCYDLLSSEARTATFLAVAKGDIPQQAWFRLGRAHVMVEGRAALVSWTGTMFEYMMPTLWMRVFPNTLLARSGEAAVRIQRDFVRSLTRNDLPWGISESGFAETDAQGRYGYHAWGIPALALKYGASAGPVIAPYATFLALSVWRRDGVANLRRMAALGWVGRYGFYEAADCIDGTEPRVVRSWMAHHQGMSLLALLNLLEDHACQRWFHANPRVRAAEMLLHEKPIGRAALRAVAQGPREPEQATA